MGEQLKEVRHDIIRYANCWEDADILIEALDVRANDRVLSIGSAGDNSFSLLAQNPELIVAVDINQVQLNLIELKKAAFKTLDYDSFLEFLGFKKSGNRLVHWSKVKKELSEELALFWEERIEEIEKGVIYEGKFEKYFEYFRTKILPWIHSQKEVDELLKPKSAEEQKAYFHKTWNTWRWRLLFKVFFSRIVMGRFGRDPKFLKEVEISVANYILGSAKKKLSSVACQSNYLLHFIMKGNFGDVLPHYARPENFQVVKRNIHKLEVFQGLAEDAFKEYNGFNRFNLSNIFEYMTPELFSAVSTNLLENGAADSRYAYWNLMVPRVISKIDSSVVLDKELYEKLGELDKGFFYSKFIVEIKS